MSRYWEVSQNGDGLLEDSLMPVGWPLHLDGAVKQRCVHRTTTLQELDDLLSAYDMKRDLVEINNKAAQWSHRAVWNQWYITQTWLPPGPTVGRPRNRYNQKSD